MNKLVEINNPFGNYEKSIDRIVAHLGQSKLRFSIFNLIYGRGSKPKSVTYIVEKLKLKSKERQLVLNEINHLKKHNLVTRDFAAAAGKGGKQAIYGKVDFVMANKEKILRRRTNPKFQKTKTRHPTRIIIEHRTSGARSIGKRGSRARLKVLYLTATPSSQDHLRTDAESRMVQEEIRGSRFRDRIELVISPAADTKSILNGINDHRPQIMHFSGHGGGKAIWLDDGKVHGSVGGAVKFDLLAKMLGATDSPPVLLVLNACNTLKGAKALLGSVSVVIAMSNSISDIGAATFAAQFYAAIASAQPVSKALTQGQIAMQSAMLKDANLPKIIHRKDVHPAKLVLLKGR